MENILSRCELSIWICDDDSPFLIAESKNISIRNNSGVSTGGEVSGL